MTDDLDGARLRCDHESHTYSDGYGYALCLDCAELLRIVTPEYLIMLLDWWDSLDHGDSDPGDCHGA